MSELYKELKAIIEEAEHSMKHDTLEMQQMKSIELNAKARKLREKYPFLPPVPPLKISGN